MAEVRYRVCDQCGEGPSETYAIQQRPNKPWVVDLCSTHAEPLLAFREIAHIPEGGRRVYRSLKKTASERP